MSGTACVVCSGILAERYPRAVDPETGDRFSILQCASCGLGHTHPVPTDLARYYDDSYHGGRHGLTAALCARRRLRLLQKHAPRAGRLLDIGCGEATFLSVAQDRGWAVAGTEQPNALQRVRAKGFDVREDIRQFDGEKPFDAVTMWHSLEHMRDPVAVLEALRDRLSRDGVLVVAVPDWGGVQARVFGARWLHLDVPRHLHHYDETSMRRLMRRVGLRIVERASCEFEYDLLGWMQSALDVVMPQPRLLFHQLTGKAVRDRRAAVASAALAPIVALAALPLTLHGCVEKRGGTLVVVARPLPQNAAPEPSAR